MHVEHARELEQHDQLEQALAEYRKALEMIVDRPRDRRPRWRSSNGRSASGSRRPGRSPASTQLRNEARGLNAPPLLNPGSREPLRMNFGQQSSLRDILNFIGTASGINVNYDAAVRRQAVQPRQSRRRHGRGSAEPGALGESVLLQGHRAQDDHRHPGPAGEAPAVRRSRHARLLHHRTPTRPSWPRWSTASCASRRWRCSR